MTEIRLAGSGVSDGIRLGKALCYTHDFQAQQFGDIEERDIPREIQRLAEAKATSIKEIEVLVAEAQLTLGAEKARIIQAQKSFLLDRAFCPEMEKLIAKKLFSAEKAAEQVVGNFITIFSAMPNEYMRERAADVRDVGHRLLTVLTGTARVKLSELRDEVILIADDLTPTDTVQLNNKIVKAFATSKGGKTSHTAIIAKTLGIPAVVGVGSMLAQIRDGQTLIIDGSAGLCIVDPEETTIRRYREKIATETAEQERLQAYGSLHAVTADGYTVNIEANIGTHADAVFAAEQGADGVGLLRTELMYMSQTSLPDEELQFAAYKDIVETIGDKPVIIRTLDIGGDKELSYLKIPQEMNPFLGYRAIRLCLDQKPLFITQLRAILRASAYGKVKIMFPMISSLEEWRSTRSIVEEVKADLRQNNIAFDENIPLGIMIEVPSAAILARQFAKEVDFFSIGTNDLVQYTLAVDRMNEKVDYLYDHFHPAVLQLLQTIVEAAHSESKPVGMCGGMAGDMTALPLLLALGLDELSMSATAISKTKFAVSKMNVVACRQLLAEVMEMSTTQEIRAKLEVFVQTGL